MGLTAKGLSQNACGLWLHSICIFSFHLNIPGTDMKCWEELMSSSLVAVFLFVVEKELSTFKDTLYCRKTSLRTRSRKKPKARPDYFYRPKVTSKRRWNKQMKQFTINQSQVLLRSYTWRMRGLRSFHSPDFSKHHTTVILTLQGLLQLGWTRVSQQHWERVRQWLWNDRSHPSLVDLTASIPALSWLWKIFWN